MNAWEKDEQFIQAARQGDVATIKMYLDPKYQAAQGYEWPAWVLVEAFVCTPSIEISEILLHTGAVDINEYWEHTEDSGKGYDRDKDTALIVAVRNNNLPKVQWLLGKSADVNKPSVGDGVGPGGAYKWCDTPLMEAAYRDRLEIAKLLIHAGADVNAKTKDGKTALSIAKTEGQTEIVQLLQSAGAKE